MFRENCLAAFANRS